MKIFLNTVGNYSFRPRKSPGSPRYSRIFRSTFIHIRKSTKIGKHSFSCTTAINRFPRVEWTNIYIRYSNPSIFAKISWWLGDARILLVTIRLGLRGTGSNLSKGKKARSLLKEDLVFNLIKPCKDSAHGLGDLSTVDREYLRNLSQA
jgi:hypothetical protein